MPVQALQCKECRAPYPLDARYVCERCFGPLEVAYDHTAIMADPAAPARGVLIAVCLSGPVWLGLAALLW